MKRLRHPHVTAMHSTQLRQRRRELVSNFVQIINWPGGRSQYILQVFNPHVVNTPCTSLIMHIAHWLRQELIDRDVGHLRNLNSS